MHISQLHIKNYKNYKDCKVDFSEGLNVIVGPNNAGKTNLLDALGFIFRKPEKNIDDFNKYELYKNIEIYKEEPPKIILQYTIEHNFSYDVEDSALSKLKPIIIYDKDAQLLEGKDGIVHIVAKLELRFELNKTNEKEYLDEAKAISNYSEYISMLKRYEQYFSWSYYNPLNGDELSDKDINEIFEIDEIPANRIINDIEEKSKNYVAEKIKKNNINEVKIQQEITDKLRIDLSSVKSDINTEIESDQNEIGITDGRNNFVSDFIFDKNLSSFFKYSLRNDKDMFDLPLDSNGLGYNNLIYIRNLIKQKKDNDYNILMIEEPEAHLHPNMQYKLLKYLNSLETIRTADSDKCIKNQIIITTHSPNISASVDMSKIVILNYDREQDIPNVIASRMSDNFEIDKIKGLFDLKEISKNEGKTEKQILQEITSLLTRSKEHLQKFLDITRSDILFSDRIILVEGLAEKLILPYIDEELISKHVSVVEVAGINFNQFLPLIFFTNKKILCITDKDYEIYDEQAKEIRSIEEYKNSSKHISYIFDKYFNDKIRVVEQEKFGSTFEKELFIENYKDKEKFKLLMKLALPKCCEKLIGERSISKWHEKYTTDISNEKTVEVIGKKLDLYWDTYLKKNGDDKELAEMMFFTNLFYKYVEKEKGNFCLEILNQLKSGQLTTPNYLTKELEWIKK